LSSPDSVSRPPNDLFKYAFRQQWEEFNDELQDAYYIKQLLARRAVLANLLDATLGMGPVEIRDTIYEWRRNADAAIREWETGEPAFMQNETRPRPEDREIDRDAITDHK
jgi:hypothetical protein